jgi:hypothetical protein
MGGPIRDWDATALRIMTNVDYEYLAVITANEL